MRATWFVLEDGNAADPAECADQDGVLTHSSGVKVAMRSPGVPRSRGVDLDESGKQLFGGKGDHDGNGAAGGAKPTDEPKPSTPAATETSAVVTEDMQPAQRPAPARNPGYQTRQGKGRR
ncbi:hypothetical protein JP75_07995 [Devosia riboflavina]|uniref:Uncharacterized protein n=1 Tax=Devosia riboflavina TaxID=46914 RepID=A0A087M3M4_9HYPH|nr:hypothetical protein [Devosia riboflavina]KFL31477.1 hypothetical protein JP75_07995 [Devosia riboflavina]